MNKLVKEAWVARLRSGKYKQAVGSLKTAKGHCCLGVLCELYNDTLKKPQSWEPAMQDRDGKVTEWEYKGQTGQLPEVVAKWAGLPDKNPSVVITTKNGDLRVLLSELNDNDHKIGGRRATFPRIADVIEAKL